MSRKRSKSVALSYDGEGAPKVVAKGSGKMARKIIELARQHGIPVYQDEEVVEYLYRVQLGQEIPEELYEAVATIIAFLIQKDESLKDRILKGGLR